MANDNNSWDVDDIDFSEIDFEDLDLDDLDFSVDGELNSINDERPKKKVDEDLLGIADDQKPARPARPARPVRKVDKRGYEPEDDDDDDEDDRPLRRRQQQGGGKTTSKAPFIIILCLILGLAVGAILFWIIKSSSDDDEASAFGDTTTEATASGETGTTAAWSKDTEEKVMDVVNSYYAAKTLGDAEGLRNVLDEVIAVDESRVSAEARVVDSYQNITVYTTDGQNEGEYVTYVEYELKFRNINTPAPGLEPFYVRPDANGNLRLLTYEYIKKNEAAIFSFMGAAGDCDAIRELGEDVETRFQNAKATDGTLADFLNSLKQNTTQSAGGSDTTTAAPNEETTAEPAGENTTEAPETTAAPSGGDGSDESFTNTDTMMYAQANVKARVKPNTSDDTTFTLVKKGTYVQVTGKGENWYRVCLKDGSTAYIMKQYLGLEKPATEAEE